MVRLNDHPSFIHHLLTAFSVQAWEENYEWGIILALKDLTVAKP